MENNDKPQNRLRTDDEMLRKILHNKLGSQDTDEFAADELELFDEYDESDTEAGEETEIGESEYFSTCQYTMIPTDDDAINNQGS